MRIHWHLPVCYVIKDAIKSLDEQPLEGMQRARSRELLSPEVGGASPSQYVGVHPKPHTLRFLTEASSHGRD